MPILDWNDEATWDEMYSVSAEPWGHPGTERRGVRMGYCRATFCWQQRFYAIKTAEALGFGPPPGPSIVLVGAGFGWTAEHWEEMGYASIICTDTSTFIQSRKDTDEVEEIRAAVRRVGLDPDDRAAGQRCCERIHGDTNDPDPWRRARPSWPQPGGDKCQCARGILNEDLMTPASRNRVGHALGLAAGQGPDVVITENVMSTLTDAEALALHAELVGWGTRLVHHITTLSMVKRGRPAESLHKGLNWKTKEAWKALLPGSEIWDFQARVVV